MANTMKFGNGQWATKKDSILAYNDENANFKPLPFVTSRASTATRVNKLGLIETVASGIPRVDYLSNTSGAYLLEPQSTNLIAQSESFGSSYWTKSGSSIEGDASTAGGEQVVNGDFATDTDWTKGAGTTISGGKANFSSATPVALYQTIGLSSGNVLVSFSVTNYTSGTLNAYVGLSQGVGTINVSANATGTYTFQMNLDGGNSNIIFGSSNSFIGSIDNVSVKEVSGFSAPIADAPLGAFKLVEGTSTGSHFMYSSNIAVTLGTVYSSFVFAKKGENSLIQLTYGSGTFNDSYANFDLNLGTVLLENNSTATIEPLANGYYKCSITATCATSGNNQLVQSLINSSTSARLESYTGDGTSGVYIFGAQLEAQSYATSYIKTSGSQITRLSDTASQTVPDGIIGQTEGVLFIEASSLVNGADNRITLSGGSSSNRVSIEFDANANTIKGFMGSNGFLQTTSYNQTNNLKIALNYKANDFKMFINGVKIGTDTTATISTGINRLDFSNYNGDVPFYGNTKDIRVYNTALTDAELAKLTKI